MPSLADLFASMGVPLSGNIEDRRQHGPLELWMTPQPLAFGRQQGPDPMAGRVASPLSAAAGFNDTPEFDEMNSARANAFSPLDRPTSMDQFRNSLALQGAMNTLKTGASSPLAWNRR